jgi:hypothetical protein
MLLRIVRIRAARPIKKLKMIPESYQVKACKQSFGLKRLSRKQTSSNSFDGRRHSDKAGSRAFIGIEFRQGSDVLAKVNRILLEQRNRLPYIERLDQFTLPVLYC